MELPKPEPLEPPYESLKDIATKGIHQVVDLATLGAGRITLEAWFGPSYGTRLEHWRVEVVNRILKLESEGITIENLQSNEKFLTALAQAAQSAVKTHEKDKRDALTNAVINSGLPTCPDDTKQQMFLLWIDSFTALHIRLLRFLQRPPAPTMVIYGGADILNRFQEEISVEIRDAAVDDLRKRQLTWIHGANKSRSRSHTTGYTTVIGDEFLEFIDEKENPCVGSAVT